jgi:hypothetical protein
VLNFVYRFQRPNATVRGERLGAGLCPRCGAAGVVTVIYGLVRDTTDIERSHPEGFILAGCLAKSVADPGPDRACRRCGLRFYADGRPG